MGYWISKGKIHSFYLRVKEFLHFEFTAIFGNTRAPGLTLLPLVVFLFIALNNSLGLVPFIFTASSHLTFTVRLALPLWLGHMILGWVKSPNRILAHLVPSGTPVLLIPFIVMIELVRNIIRPLTLSVRLAANIVAGHLLLTLLGNLAPAGNGAVVVSVLIILVLLTVLETAVALIQAYVFSVLNTLYFDEVNSTRIR